MTRRSHEQPATPGASPWPSWPFPWLPPGQAIPPAQTAPWFPWTQPTADGAAPVAFDPDKVQAVQRQYLADIQALLQPAGEQAQAPRPDRRFASDEWRSNPTAAYAASAYQAHARALQGLAEAFLGDGKQRARVQFAVQQWVDAMAPSNFLALNADAIRKAIDTQGESLTRGLNNLLKDLRQGHLSQTDETVFEVGRNLATTEGAVVFENELFQLIEYKPLTAQVHERPLLIVPPCINKYYILDLQPENSLVRYAVEQGMRTFVISWRNPDASLSHATWDDYVEQAVIRAIEVTAAISGQDKRGGKINALGFCVGGTLLGTALAVLAGRGKKPAASVTLLTTFLDFADTGVLDIFIDEAFVRLRELQMGQSGLLKGQELASTFSFLRPNELVWNYVGGNYLKGETPPPFDLLYWNSDATNLPGPFYAWYLRNTYFENNLAQPGKVKVCGVPVDLRQVDIPAYLYASREDHIVPATSAYASTRHLPGPVRFVLGASGHIAGVINPPAKRKRSHWTWDAKKGAELPEQLGQWVEQATEQPGSWWPDWSQWLQGHAGRKVKAPTSYGSDAYPALEPAPGRYVRAKADAQQGF
ncbi:MAG: Poly(3-hydroxyalkanoate) polymerase subunit PhaC [Paracidovorax wautersii]|uniref:Poly(3-hydroxyalkanoate) polymerase subunit PhaC n=1 Tax=Paracidovorax wautersii TaxID=1177982 RepID=A0A7V8FQT6_9BURK|nr:MAG: Poly(3-hydroxyalkanoate) polymerase subunit PhaC [Paracidovorax wautersii]